MLERITSLTSPPTIGRYYLVPTVSYKWLNAKQAKPWPVFMTKHEDGEHLNFPWLHYHVDPRFLLSRELDFAERYRRGFGALAVCQGYPLQRSGTSLGSTLPHPPVVWARRRCARAVVPYALEHLVASRLSPAFLGRTCKRARTGWVCPHKHVALGSFAPVAGVITCPLHGLQIDAETGVVVGPLSTPSRAAA